MVPLLVHGGYLVIAICESNSTPWVPGYSALLHALHRVHDFSQISHHLLLTARKTALRNEGASSKSSRWHTIDAGVGPVPTHNSQHSPLWPLLPSLLSSQPVSVEKAGRWGVGRSYSLALCPSQRPSLTSSHVRSWQSRQISELRGHCVCSLSPEEVLSSVALSHWAQAFFSSL